MKNIDLKYGLTLLGFTFGLFALSSLALYQSMPDTPEEPKIEEYTPKAEYYEDVRERDWEIFIEALMWVESKGDERAVGKKNDVGVLQITPILLEDVNRILGHDKYSLKDRYDREKSIEMFNIIQDHYNPQHDMHWALKLWNSGAPLSYHRKVMDKFNEIKNKKI